MVSEFDPVQKAEHYNLHPSGVECIDIVRHHDFSTGNAIKYLWRAGLKEPEDPDKEIQDLEKADYYVQCRIAQLKDAKEAERLRYEALGSISDLGCDENPSDRTDRIGRQFFGNDWVPTARTPEDATVDDVAQFVEQSQRLDALKESWRAGPVDWQERINQWNHDYGIPQYHIAGLDPEDWRHLGYVVGGESANFNEED